MGLPAPSAGRRSAASTADSPRCISSVAVKRGGCGLPFRQRPQALSAATVSVGGGVPARDWIPVRAPLHIAGVIPPGYRETPRAATVRLERPAVAGRPRWYRNVRGGRLPSRVGPCRCGISGMAYRALPGASPRSLRYSCSVARRTRSPAPVAGFPRQRLDCSRRARLPGLPGFPG